MKIDTNLLDDHQIELTVEIENEVMEKAKHKAARKISKKVKISGFRPGKAPYNVIQNQVGDGAILEEALDLLLDDLYPKIIDEAEINPYGPGSLKNVASMEPPTLEFLVPLAPEVEIGAYREIRSPWEPKEVKEEDVQEVLDNLREQQAIIESVDRPSEESDMVSVVLTGKRIDQDDSESEDNHLFEERRLPIVIEKAETDTVNEWPFPGYSRMLIGVAAGEKKTMEYTFPDDYEREDWQSIKAEFISEIEEIKARSLPKLDDEFAKSAGDYEGLDNLKEEITKSLTQRFENEQKAEYDNGIIDKILEITEFKFPPQMVDHEIEHQLQDLNQRLSYQGLNMEVYLKSREIDEEGLREEMQPLAKDRIQRGLILSEVAKQEKIEVKSEEVEERLKQTIDEINNVFPKDEAKKLLTGESLQNLVNRLITDEVTERTLERLRLIAKGKKIPEDEPVQAENTAPAAQQEKYENKKSKKKAKKDQPEEKG